MKIGILSRESKNYSTSRIKEACIKRGHKVKIFDTLKFTIHHSR
ncbi:MAG: ribosomal protein S6--L-glutamate ligase [Candidatus Omnitrophota bacterium]|jgi:ribosomal protein S6--L-glutamate ligase